MSQKSGRGLPESLGEVDLGLVSKRREFDPGAGREVVPIWYGEHDRFACKRYQLDARRAVAGQRDEGEVEASLLDFAGHGDGAAHVSNLNGDSCVLGTKGGEDPDEVDRSHPLGLHRAEQDGSAQAAASFIYGVSRRLRRCQRGASFRQ